ncbi:MAG: 2-C-methyl-D-erythritol 4-phosphate cytidylyltransferase [Solirubrobacteraceae bacterium]
MAVALILAAGRGERLAAGEPKALTMLAGRPMFEWSVDALRSVHEVDRIVLALPADHLDAAPAGVIAVAGGATRSQSVRAALKAADGADTDESVIVHDAARPLASPELFTETLRELWRSGADAVVAAIPVTDTIKHVPQADRRVQLTVDRAQLWSAQTPQVFRRHALERALAAPAELLEQATDDAWLVEQQGGTVVVHLATAENFKITRPFDLLVAELLLRERAGSHRPRNSR